MARYAQLTLLGFAVLMLAGLGHVLLDLQGKQLAQRNNQRAKDVIYFLDLSSTRFFRQFLNDFGTVV